MDTAAETSCSCEQTLAVFLDVEKGVWHPGLVHKLRVILLSDCYIHLMASYHWKRIFCVRVVSAVSSERGIITGVPQGSFLGPLLFSVYGNNVPKMPEV